MANTLFYGDNLRILRDHIPDESIDLIYLDPPFNSNRTYNVLFREKSGEASPAQIEAFTDAWTWDRAAERQYDELLIDGPPNVSQMIGALRQFIGSNDMMAYLVMMAARLVELHRVLKPTGSLYLHCDPTASHYLKIVLDSIFSVLNFRNEITWKRATTIKGNAGQGSKLFGNNTDSILFYTKTNEYQFNPQFNEYRDEYLSDFYKYKDQDGRVYRLISMIGPGGASKGNPFYEVMGVSRHWRYSQRRMQELIDAGLVVQSKPGAVPQRKQYLDEGKGAAVQSLWDEIPALSASSVERLGYPTQKPLALLERIINASSNPGDVVLDPFCGCGTAIVAAQKLGRQWIGIDVTHLAITLIKNRLSDSFPGIEFDVRGEPADEGAARMLAEADRYQFQWWALSLVHAKPAEGKEKKGADRGIDGVIVFVDDATHKPKRCLVQVKSGHVNRGTVEQLVGTITREQAELGLLITLEASTAPMRQEAVEAGFYESIGWGRQFPKVQIVTIDELLSGRKPDLPPARQTFQQAPVIGENIQQTALGLVAE